MLMPSTPAAVARPESPIQTFTGSSTPQRTVASTMPISSTAAATTVVVVDSATATEYSATSSATSPNARTSASHWANAIAGDRGEHGARVAPAPQQRHDQRRAERQARGAETVVDRQRP